jgi:hypothetical protein
MTEVMSSLMKIILGLVVLIAVVAGVSLLFKNNIISFFKGLAGSETTAGAFLTLLK